MDALSIPLPVIISSTKSPRFKASSPHQSLVLSPMIDFVAFNIFFRQNSPDKVNIFKMNSSFGAPKRFMHNVDSQTSIIRGGRLVFVDEP